ncbi:MAG: hypothetical protein KIT84_44385 [Labilithrix sp.]|nr:hypothetical protein [Labilithrix sp.]MCW5818118.1 hypothetical protein [Labilithrix sp.]
MRTLLVAATAALALLFACSSDDDTPGGGASSTSSSSSSSSTGGTPPDPSTLFDPLPPATPDKLRGVWETKESGDTGQIALRLRFTDDYIAGTARCTSPAGQSLDAPNLTGIDSADIDAKEGVIAVPGGLQFSAADGDFKCNADLPGGDLAFVIEGTTLTLALEGAEGTLTFTKVGD